MTHRRAGPHPTDAPGRRSRSMFLSFALWLALRCTIAGVCATACANASARCADGRKMIGVNLAGAEFNAEKLPGAAFTDYVYPDAAEMQYFRTLGVNVFRLPILWERLQPGLFGELDTGEMHRIQEVAMIARKQNACLIIDVHNYGEYRGKPLGTSEVPGEAFIDLWKRVLAGFPDSEHVAFGLMNEPSKLRIADWADISQRTVNALRKENSRHLILVAGGRWSGAHDWNEAQGGISNADAFRSFRDAASNVAIEVHQYADRDFSGTGTNCVDREQLQSIMANVTQWAEKNRQRLFLGEFGAASERQCLRALDTILDAVGNNAVWLGATYWAAGRWWGNYPLSIEPDGQGDKPQADIIKKHITH